MDLHWFGPEKQNPDSTPKSSWAVFFGPLRKTLGCCQLGGLEGLTTCGALWQPVAPYGSLWHGDPTPYKQVNKKIRCIEPGGLWG